MSLVYFVLDATRTRQTVKIGVTTNLAARLNDLRSQTASGGSPLLLAVIEGSFPGEHELHERFAAKRLWGEWFDYDDELRSFIALLPNPLATILDEPRLWADARGWRTVPNVPPMREAANGTANEYVPVEF